MKKIIAIAAIAIAAVSMATAKGKGFSPVVGVHGYVDEAWGTTINGASDDTKRPIATNMGFGGGVFANLTLNGSFGVQPEVNFYMNNVGTQSFSSSSLLNSSITTDYKMTYMSLDIPVLLTYRVNKFNLCVGPYISIPVGNPTTSTKTVTKVGDNVNTGNSNGSWTVDNGVLFGLTAGLEYEQRIGTGRLIYGARYLLDFTPVKTYTGTDSDGNKQYAEDFTRRALELTVGYKIAL